ncbi:MULTISPECIES: YbdD/YjiX family protein [Streptomyces]|uniref:CstA-like transporter-associated (seleno)protein n=1 Tax=Streptomyces TaxID=1883 RepID=UPI000CD57273|nr:MULTISPECIES: YbdD/YjiX family protein [Streptomyces]
MRRAARGLWWYLTELTGELTGDNAYRRYSERARREDPAAAVMTRREFERERADARAARPNGGGRCC